MTARMTSTSGPRSMDAGLLILRLGAGLPLALIFGLPKLQAAALYLHTGQWAFVDFNRKVGLPAPVVAAFLQTLNESIGALLVACGFLTRYAAASLALGFAVATFCSLRVGEPTWLTAAYFCINFLALSLTGSGRFAIDSLLQSRSARRLEVSTN
jgi:uncharacterized membrane protein YphA (DoxX/SURF4 family)